MTCEKRSREPIVFVVVLMSVFLLTTWIQLPGKESAAQSEMSVYLPQPSELKDWEPVAAPQHMKGEDLFLLINGGAEIYHEYGFKQVIVQGFKNKNRESLKFNLEIYEMQNPAAAYGIYTFKTGASGKIIPVGNEGLLEDYYLNSWKGNFLVTVIGFDSKKETLDGLVETARLVAAKIKETGQKPALVQRLPEEYKNRLKSNGIKYLKGNLALFNYYDFGPGDIFGLKEGVIGDYRDFKLLISRYSDSAECRERFNRALKHFKKNPRFSNFAKEKDAFSMTGAKAKPVHIHYYRQYIFVLTGKKREEVKAMIKKIKKMVPAY